MNGSKSICLTTAASGPRSPKQLIEFSEQQGAELRRLAGTGLTERLDPLSLADQFRIMVIDPDQLSSLSDYDREIITGLSGKDWSGGAWPMPDGSLLVMLNPNQTPERRNVTLMEEIAHQHLGHPPSCLRRKEDGTWERSYDKVVEEEAYWTAAAALLPRRIVGKAVWERCTAANLAQKYGVSVELVEFRIKTLNLWPHYNAYRLDTADTSM